MQRGGETDTNGDLNMTKLVFEAFGSIKDEETRDDDASLEDVVKAALERLAVPLSHIDTIVTGMDPDVTYALEDVVEDLDADIHVRALYPDNWDELVEEHGDRATAFKEYFSWRNRALAEGSEDYEPADMFVRVGDASYDGVELLSQGKSKRVPAVDINMDDMIDRDKAYDSDEADTEADSAQAQA